MIGAARADDKCGSPVGQGAVVRACGPWHAWAVQELPGRVQEALDRYRAKLVKRFGARLRELRLFGSYARREARPDSDVDILVVIDRLTSGEWRDACGLAYDVLMECGVYVGGLTCSREEWEDLLARERRIAVDIVREGVPL